MWEAALILAAVFAWHLLVHGEVLCPASLFCEGIFARLAEEQKSFAVCGRFPYLRCLGTQDLFSEAH